MKIKVLLADASDIMRSAIRQALLEEPAIQVVGEASSFSKTMQMIADLQPDVVLLDLHLAEKHPLDPGMVKSQLEQVGAVVAVSFAIDQEARKLAESYGATKLLDKVKLYDELIPAIIRHSQKRPGASA